jgi:hypothetical protein
MGCPVEYLGFLDMVKSSVSDVGQKLNDTVDTQKLDYKIREEERSLDRIAKEIGGIVATQLMSGGHFDEASVAEPMSRYVEVKNRIYSLQEEKASITGTDPPVREESAYVPPTQATAGNDTEASVTAPVPAIAETVPETPAPEPVAEPIPETPAPEPVPEVAEPEAVAAEPVPETAPEQPVEKEAAVPKCDMSWNSVDSDTGWVDVRNEIFWSESAPAQVAPVQEAPVQEQPVIKAEPVEGPQSDSPLSRIQSYKSDQYSGERF